MGRLSRPGPLLRSFFLLVEGAKSPEVGVYGVDLHITPEDVRMCVVRTLILVQRPPGYRGATKDDSELRTVEL